ncbi:hypothetical protein F0562_022909 [Nyssa sinensis]|uniref:Uncharacterized protein n=1 Tax=Nyssa sinensis TaxID=561372 RepID=A0A5J5BIX4_9ASTE|nr:hypothetical protein F0562_022909 [Nyssa sinensis]
MPIHTSRSPMSCPVPYADFWTDGDLGGEDDRHESGPDGEIGRGPPPQLLEMGNGLSQSDYLRSFSKTASFRYLYYLKTWGHLSRRRFSKRSATSSSHQCFWTGGSCTTQGIIQGAENLI